MKNPKIYELQSDVNEIKNQGFKVSITCFTDKMEDAEEFIKLVKNSQETNKNTYTDDVKFCLKCGNTWVQK